MEPRSPLRSEASGKTWHGYVELRSRPRGWRPPAPPALLAHCGRRLHGLDLRHPALRARHPARARAPEQARPGDADGRHRRHAVDHRAHAAVAAAARHPSPGRRRPRRRRRGVRVPTAAAGRPRPTACASCSCWREECCARDARSSMAPSTSATAAWARRHAPSSARSVSRRHAGCGRTLRSRRARASAGHGTAGTREATGMHRPAW